MEEKEAGRGGVSNTGGEVSITKEEWQEGGEVLKKGELEDTFSQGLHFLHEQEAGSPLRVNGAGVG